MPSKRYQDALDFLDEATGEMDGDPRQRGNAKRLLGQVQREGVLHEHSPSVSGSSPLPERQHHKPRKIRDASE